MYTILIGAIAPTSTTSIANIAISKTVDNANPVAGDTVHYLVTATAFGPATSTFVDVQDSLPTGLSFLNATTSQGSYNFGTGDWSIGTLSPNATATLAIAAVIDGRDGGQTIVNTATISELTSLVDNDPANNSSSVSIFVKASPSSTPTANLSIVKTVDNAAPQNGATVNYTVIVSALGPATSTGVTATDTLPSGIAFLSATASQGSYASSTGTWNIGDMSASSSATLQIAATVTAAAGTSVTNLASVGETASSTDQNPGNAASSTLTVATPATPGCTSNCGGGGGGGSYGVGGGIYQNFNLLIDGGAATTITPTSTLTLTATGATQMWISNDPSFSTSTSSGQAMSTPSTGSVSTGWIPFAGTYPWTLTSGAGEKTVYARFGNSGKQTGNAQAAIQMLSDSGGQVLGASSTCGIYLTSYIHPVRTDLNYIDQVKKLQTFLNGNLGTNLPVDGSYGPMTIAAVNQFQVKYSAEVLAPWVQYGLPNASTPTGYVYKTTQRWINILMCPPLNLPIPQLP